MKNIFKLPSAKELGMTKTSGMPMRRFGYTGNEKTWEDYYEYIEKHYPIRNFLFNTIPHWFAVRIRMPLEDLYFKIMSKLFWKQHLIDIRNPEYQGGYISWKDAILFSSFKILDNHIKYTYTSLEDLKDWITDLRKMEADSDEYNRPAPGQLKHTQSIYELYDWFINERPKLVAKVEDESISYEERQAFQKNLLESENLFLKGVIDVRDYI